MEVHTGDFPHKPHFFKPLIQGFHHGLLIPIAFLKSLNLNNEGDESDDEAVLRTGLGEWKVRIKSGFLRDGWVDFIKDHDLHVSDVLVFKHEGDLVFDVTVFAPSTCEREYKVPEDHHKIAEKESPNISDLSRSEQKYNNWSRACLEEGACSPCLVSWIKPYNTKHSEFVVPSGFAKSHGLNNRHCKVLIIDADHEERTWNVSLHQKKRGEVVLMGGWSDFRIANELNVGDVFTLELIDKGTNPVMVFRRPKGMLRTAEVSTKPKKLGSQWPLYFIYTLSRTSVRYLSLYMQKAQIGSTGLSIKQKVTIKDPNRRHWPVSLIYDGRNSYRTQSGWKDVVIANELKVGDFIKLEPVGRAETVVMILSICYRSSEKGALTEG